MQPNPCRFTLRQRFRKPRRATCGFSLIELVVVVIIVGILASIAVPRFIDLGRNARVAALNALSGTLWSAANEVHMACALSPSCDLNNIGLASTINGRSAETNYGWPEAGDRLGVNQIDVWINYSGFTASLPNLFVTRFALDGAPDPANCSVDYHQAGFPSSTQLTPTVIVNSSGC